MTALDKSKPVPLYQQCADIIRKRIEHGDYRPGEFIPPERALCLEFDVARLTLRKSLAELIRDGYIQSMAGAGNRVLDRNQTILKTIGCVIARNLCPPSFSPVYSSFLGGIERTCSETGARMVLTAVSRELLWANDTRKESARIVNDNGVDAVICIGGMSDAFVLQLRDSGKPVILLDKILEQPGITSVMPDNFSGAFQATEHLLKLGHRRILFMGAPWDVVVKARFEGFLKAHDDAGIEFDRTLRAEGNYENDISYEAACMFFNSHTLTDRPTAVFAVNDQSAFGVIRACNDMGISVPGDVSVVGFDDIHMSDYMIPPLTTVRVDREEMSRCAVTTALEQLKRPNKPIPASTERVPVSLIVRGSTAPVKQQ